MYTEGLQLKVKRLSRDDLERLAVSALFHLRVVSGSRNSFSRKTMEQWAEAGLYAPERDPQVEAMQRRAAEFIAKEDA